MNRRSLLSARHARAACSVAATALLAACSIGDADTTDDFTASNTGSSSSPTTSETGPVQATTTSPATDGTGGTDGTVGTDSTDGTVGTDGTDGTDGTSVTTGSDTTAGTASTTVDPSSPGSSGETTIDPTGLGPGPAVVETTPEDGLSGVDFSSQITVTFSEAMKASTITTNTADTSCSGSVQVSRDDFATCVQMTEEPEGSPDLTTWTLIPATLLESTASYKIRVTTEAQSSDDLALAEEFSSEGFTVRYYHPITIDGVNDFTADETFSSSTDGFTGYVAWDKAFLYVGYAGTDLENGSSDKQFKWLLVYLGGPNGSTTGNLYNTQEPTLPFSARWHVRYRLDGNNSTALEWGGGMWASAWSLSQNDVSQSDGYVELRVPLTDLGDPETLQVHVTMINEKGLAEWTWGAVPSGSITDSYNPNYGAHYEFDMVGSTIPVDHNEL